MKDDFGNRMKEYEGQETSRKFMPLLPIYARIDGRNFSNFTKGMKRPYDPVMSNLMVDTTKSLVDRTKAVIGYTQSDEISLAWESSKDLFFEGKIQKITSVLASLATIIFITKLQDTEYNSLSEKLPHFDCRIFPLPSKMEVANSFLWREQDATKNAISMAARAYYSHTKLQGKNGNEMQEMLFQKGVNFNDYPAFFKRGTFVRKEIEERFLTEEELAKIPEQHRPKGMITRSKMVELKVPKFSTVTNRIDFIFNKNKPLTSDNA